MFGFAVDVQTGVPRFWTGVGDRRVRRPARFCSTTGDVSLSWITLLLGRRRRSSLFMLGGMPAMVRTRFSTPTIGREWMIGELGEARTAVDPDGTVAVRDAPVAGPHEPGDAHRRPATGPGRRHLDGLVLEVEPLEGAARDYRDRSHRGPNTASGISGQPATPMEPERSTPSGRDPA